MTNYEKKQGETFAEMRGVCSFEYKGPTVFVKANVDDVARALSKKRNANRYLRCRG